MVDNEEATMDAEDAEQPLTPDDEEEEDGPVARRMRMELEEESSEDDDEESHIDTSGARKT